MFERFRSIQERRATAQGDEQGFTLIELLIVIVVMGILAAVVVFALGGVTGQSAVAACKSDASSVETSVQAYLAQNPAPMTAVVGTAGGAGQSQLVAAFLHTYPVSTHYVISVTTTGEVDVTPTSGTLQAYDTETATTGCNVVK